MFRPNYYKLRRKLVKNFSDKDMKFLHALQDIALSYDGSDVPERVGFQVLGPILLGYSSWLHREALASDANMIVFLSREGGIMKQAYEQLYGTDEFRTAYVNVSRLSVFKAHVIHTQSWSDLAGMFVPLLRGNPSVDSFLELLGLDENIRKECVIPLDRKLVDVEDTGRLYNFIISRGRDYFTEQNKMLKMYLHQKGITGGKVILSDIGYSGTMQFYLSGLTPHVKYLGRYVSMRERKYYSDERYKAHDRKGWWIDIDEDGTEKSCMRDLTVSAFERLFLSDEGTTVGYVESAGLVEPVKVSEDIGDSTITRRLHSSALKFLQDASAQINIDEAAEANPEVFFVPYVNFGVYPSGESVEFYRHFSFINGAAEFTFIPAKSFLYYLMHPAQAYRELSLSSKIIWLKGLLRIPFPLLRVVQVYTYAYKD